MENTSSPWTNQTCGRSAQKEDVVGCHIMANIGSVAQCHALKRKEREKIEDRRTMPGRPGDHGCTRPKDPRVERWLTSANNRECTYRQASHRSAVASPETAQLEYQR
ncbi:hypothetical protein NDU88_007561 [Pleurodeles waltl]|uniref:Uncharacterized protein n=1 Tax=Pleurodeles waltl TaxID=8319 RepID=A0AAV7RVF6_PLEWA|nr:hypothetical protein NDU88_007561 [Pleurodeles waltl]